MRTMDEVEAVFRVGPRQHTARLQAKRNQMAGSEQQVCASNLSVGTANASVLETDSVCKCTSADWLQVKRA